MVRILGRGIKAAQLGWNSGAIALAVIKVPIPERLEEPVSCDSLLDQIQQAFAPITAHHVTEIIKVASA